MHNCCQERWTERIYNGPHVVIAKFKDPRKVSQSRKAFTGQHQSTLSISTCTHLHSVPHREVHAGDTSTVWRCRSEEKKTCGNTCVKRYTLLFRHLMPIYQKAFGSGRILKIIKEIFTASSCRRAESFVAYRMGIPIRRITEQGRWANKTVLQNYYLRHDNWPSEPPHPYASFAALL